MDDKTPKLLLTLGTIVFCFVAPVFLYFASLLIACFLSSLPLWISLILGFFLFIALIASITIFVPKLKLKILFYALSVFVCATPVLIIDVRFHKHDFSNGYIRMQGDPYSSYDSYNHSNTYYSPYHYYDKFGRKRVSELIIRDDNGEIVDTQYEYY